MSNHVMSKRALMVLFCAMALALPTLASAKDLKEVIKTKTLSNGLQVIVIENHSIPLVTVEIAVKNGAFTEPPEFNGLSHLYEHMFFKGNAVIPTQEAYLRRIRELGIVFNGTTSSERVNYYFTLPSKNAKEGLVFMRDAIMTPKFDEKEFKKEIQVVIGEVDRNESNPYYWLGQAVEAKVWHKYPTRKDSLGDRKTITTATVAKMKEMQKRYYVPNNSALLIAGDIKPEAAFKMAEELFKGWKKSDKDPHVTYPVPEHPPIAKSEAVVTLKKVRTPYFQMVWHGPSVTKDPKATFAADVLSFILSQPASTFHKNLVDSGLTLGAGLSYYTQKYKGPITASAQVLPGKVKPAIKAFIKELYKLTDPNYYTDAQLESAKKILTVQAIYEREKTSNLAHTVSFWWASTSLDYYFNYVKNLNAVTRQDISNYIKTYVVNKPFVLGVLSSPEIAQKHQLDVNTLNGLIDEVQKELAKPAATKATK